MLLNLSFSYKNFTCSVVRKKLLTFSFDACIFTFLIYLELFMVCVMRNKSSLFFLLVIQFYLYHYLKYSIPSTDLRYYFYALQNISKCFWVSLWVSYSILFDSLSIHAPVPYCFTFNSFVTLKCLLELGFHYVYFWRFFWLTCFNWPSSNC